MVAILTGYSSTPYVPPAPFASAELQYSGRTIYYAWNGVAANAPGVYSKRPDGSLRFVRTASLQETIPHGCATGPDHR